MEKKDKELYKAALFSFCAGERVKNLVYLALGFFCAVYFRETSAIIAGFGGFLAALSALVMSFDKIELLEIIRTKGANGSNSAGLRAAIYKFSDLGTPVVFIFLTLLILADGALL